MDSTALPPTPPPPIRRFRESWIFKLIAISLLVICLLIGAHLTVGDLIGERRARQDAVTESIAAAWGHPQTLLGPLLVVPYSRLINSRNSRDEVIAVREQALAIILPDQLKLTITLKPELRKRGLFSTVVYSAEIKGAGRLPAFDPTRFPGTDVAVRWAEARVVLSLSDLRAIDRQGSISLGDHGVDWEPGATAAPFLSHAELMSAPVGALPQIGQGGTEFAFELTVAGSGGFSLIPIGKETHVTVSSSWPHPSFGGQFLPARTTITDAGFTAEWRLTQFGRSFAQQIPAIPPTNGPNFTAAAFGVELLPLVTQYRMVERALKYAILVIAGVFGVFVLFELLSRLRLHPIQYALVGTALVLQFVLLLAFAEQIGFALAYLASAGAVMGLIAHYARSALKSGRAALIAGAVLAAIYGIIFVLLQLADHALLAGALALFAGLAAFMHLTRRIDWSAV